MRRSSVITIVLLVLVIIGLIVALVVTNLPQKESVDEDTVVENNESLQDEKQQEDVVEETPTSVSLDSQIVKDMYDIVNGRTGDIFHCLKKGKLTVKDLPNELLMMQSVYSSTNDYLNNSGTWFISTIFILYIFYPYIQHLLKNNKINIIYIIITLIFFSVYPSIILAYFNENITTIYSNPIFRIPEFTIGMCIAKIYTANKHKKYSVMIPAFLSLITVVTISILCHNNFVNHISFRYKYPLFNIAVVPLFGLIIYFTALIKSKSVISFCKSFPVQYSAKISFAFYIVQCWTFYIYYTFLKNNLSSSVTAMCILLFVINILFSILVYEIIEKRLITILKTIIYKKIQN